MLKEIKSK